MGRTLLIRLSAKKATVAGGQFEAPSEAIKAPDETWREFGNRCLMLIATRAISRPRVVLVLATELVVAVRAKIDKPSKKNTRWLAYELEEQLPWDAEMFTVASVDTKNGNILAVAVENSVVEEFVLGLQDAGVHLANVVAESLAVVQGLVDDGRLPKGATVILPSESGLELVTLSGGKVCEWFGPFASRLNLEQRLELIGNEYSSGRRAYVVQFLDSGAEPTSFDGCEIVDLGADRLMFLGTLADRIASTRFRPWVAIRFESTLAQSGLMTLTRRFTYIGIAISLLLGLGAIALEYRAMALRSHVEEFHLEKLSLARSVLGDQSIRSPERALKSEHERLSLMCSAGARFSENASFLRLVHDVLAHLPGNGQIELSQCSIISGKVTLRGTVKDTATIDAITKVFNSNGYSVDQVKYGVEFELTISEIRPAKTSADERGRP